MHGGELRGRGAGQVDVEGLGLADVGPAVRRLVDHALLLDLPHRLVQVLLWGFGVGRSVVLMMFVVLVFVSWGLLVCVRGARDRRRRGGT